MGRAVIVTNRSFVTGLRPILKVLVLAVAIALTGQAQGPEPTDPAKRVVIFGVGKRAFPKEASNDYPDTEAYSQDLIQLVAKSAGLTYRVREFESSTAILQAFDDHEIDVLPVVARIPEREGRMLFSVPHVRGGLVAVENAKHATMNTVASLSHKRIAIAHDSYEYNFAKRTLDAPTFVLCTTILECLYAVRDGRADAAIASELPTISTIHHLRLDEELKVTFSLPDSVIDYCLAVHLGDTRLLAELNDGLFLAEQNGELRRSYDKWFYTFDLTESTRVRLLKWIACGVILLLVLGLGFWGWHRDSIRRENVRTEEITRLVDARTSELARAVEQLRDSEEKFAKAFRANPTAIAILDYETREFLDVNEQYPRYFGFTREELIGSTPAAIGVWRDVGDHDRYVRQLREKGSVRDMEVECRRKDGQMLICILSAEVAQFGPRRCVVATLSDVTERRAMEAEKDKLKAQLQHSHRLEAVGTLAGGIAHDFNNILTAILANTELADLSADPHEIHDHLGEVRQACQRAKELVRRILMFSRREKQERVQVQLPQLLEETVGLLRSTIPANIEFRTNFAPDTPRLLADSGQIHQVVVNLCTNAVHAMKDQGGILSLTSDELVITDPKAFGNPELRAGRYARLIVGDTGHGMDAETVRHIFEPFYTTKGPGEGTGLGLAVVHGIVQDHRGSVVVSSRLNEGTLITVYFPEAPAGSSARAITQNKVAPVGRSESILVVDDDAMVLSSIKRMIETGLHYEVTAIGEPQKALALFRESPGRFNLVMTDLSMPGMTGIDLAREILQLRPSIPILLMTGYSDKWTKEKVQTVGIRDLIMKPVNLCSI